MFSQLHVIAYLSVGILVYQLAFGALLVVAARACLQRTSRPCRARPRAVADDVTDVPGRRRLKGSKT